MADETTTDQSLYADVLRRLAEARELLGGIDLADGTRRAIDDRLTKVERLARSDLTHASRKLDEILFPLRRGVEPVPLPDV